MVHSKSPDREALKKLEAKLGVPHSEDTLVLLVNVSIVAGNKELAEHLSGLTMRVDVLQELAEILRRSGYPGYEKNGINSPEKVSSRIQNRYTEKVW